MNAMEQSAEKERLFERYNRREIPFDELSRRVYAIDHPKPHWPRQALVLLIAAFLPLLFIGVVPQMSQNSGER
jgi:hypothetical protein